jgi:hypothetical protein
VPEPVVREAEQKGIRFKGKVKDVHILDVKQSAGKGVAVCQTGVDGWEPNGNPEPKVSQFAAGEVLKQDRVINANSG